MARVFLTSAVAHTHGADHRDLVNLSMLERCAAVDRLGVHEVVHDAENADVVLFAEGDGCGLLQQRLLRHPLVRRLPNRCFVYCPMDLVAPVLPGLYPSIRKSAVDTRRHAASHYLRTLFRDVPAVELAPRATYLASFVGRFRSHPCRERLEVLAGPRIHVERSDAEVDWKRPGPWFQGYAVTQYAHFLEVSRESAFVLCPRGVGTSSFRIFESMQMGRVPVIVSDDWVAPEGPNWSLFSLRVPERDVGHVPEMLAKLEPRAAEMGRLARRAWDAWFSEEVTFHHFVERCRRMQRDRPRHERWLRMKSLAFALNDPALQRQLVRRGGGKLVNELKRRLP